MIPLTNLYENPVSYREVTEVNDDNSFMTNTFISHVEIKDQLPYTNLIPEYSPYSEFTDMGFYRGRQKETYYYSSDNTLVKSKNIIII
ncbi:MAG: hypothetical protein IPJ13_30290 [Saprospiraceae bacterium]|nr:hypothetical protein [Saprospiraceae bacterium]